MATVNGVTAEYAQTILDQTIESAEISGSALLLHRTDGSSFSAGDFSAYITAQIASALSGGVTDWGDKSGALTFGALTSAQMVNRVFTTRLVGNVTLNSSAFPASPLPGTQFAIRFTQDGTGGRTLTLTGIKKSQGALALSTAAGAIDIIMFMYDGTNWYAGAMGVAFS